MRTSCSRPPAGTSCSVIRVRVVLDVSCVPICTRYPGGPGLAPGIFVLLLRPLRGPAWGFARGPARDPARVPARGPARVQGWGPARCFAHGRTRGPARGPFVIPLGSFRSGSRSEPRSGRLGAPLVSRCPALDHARCLAWSPLGGLARGPARAPLVVLLGDPLVAPLRAPLGAPLGPRLLSRFLHRSGSHHTTGAPMRAT